MKCIKISLLIALFGVIIPARFVFADKKDGVEIQVACFGFEEEYRYTVTEYMYEWVTDDKSDEKPVKGLSNTFVVDETEDSYIYTRRAGVSFIAVYIEEPKAWISLDFLVVDGGPPIVSITGYQQISVKYWFW